MVSVESTTLQATTAITGPITSSAALLNLTALRTAATDVTSTLSKNRFLDIPLRFAALFDRTVLFIWHQIVVEATNLCEFIRGGLAIPGAAAGVQAMADAGVPAGVAPAAGDLGTEGWAAFFAEAFQASTFKSYWGMLHYLTSRWAFTCFAMVSPSAIHGKRVFQAD
jgi:hypothetical protein